MIGRKILTVLAVWTTCTATRVAGNERESSLLGVSSRNFLRERTKSMLSARLLVASSSSFFSLYPTIDTLSSTNCTTTVLISARVDISDKITKLDGVGLICAQHPDELLDFVPLYPEKYTKEDTTVTVDGDRFTIATTFQHLRQCDLALKYLRDGGFESDAYALRGGLLNRDPSTPYHLRIAYGPEPQTQMWMSFTTDSNISGIPYVLVGEQSGNYTRKFLPSAVPSATGDYWDSYFPADMCGAPANRTSPLHYLFPGYFANVLVKDLKPATLYYAVVGSGTHGVKSEETTFTTAAVASADAPPVRIATFGDMALSVKGAMSTVHHITQLHSEGKIDMVLHFGDLGYALGSTLIWDLWHTYIEPASRQIPYLVSVGNHEVDHSSMVCYQDPSGEAGADGTGFHPTNWGVGGLGDDSGGEGGVPIFHRFRSPACVADASKEKGDGNSIFWYSLATGSVHMIQLSSEQDMAPGSKQYAWLSHDLASIDRSVTPWVIVTLHRPMANLEAGSAYDEGQGLVMDLEPLFLQWGVDVVLGGHAHVYERMYPMKNMTCTPTSEGGITYITVGSAGATVHNDTMVDGYEELLVAWRVEWGFGIITAVNRSALHWEFFSNSEGAVVDDTWIFKG